MIIQREKGDQEFNDNMKTTPGIGLFKIRYEMDVDGSKRDHNYMAGIISYTSKEAVDTLIAFAKENVKGFKGMRVDEVAYEGLVHSMSKSVRDAVLKTAVLEGEVVSKADYDALLAEGKKKVKKDSKKSVIPKE